MIPLDELKYPPQLPIEPNFQSQCEIANELFVVP